MPTETPAKQTIELDGVAYALLEKVRRDGESFSDTLKRVIWDPEPFMALMDRFDADPLSDDAIDAVEQVVAARNGRPSRVRRNKA